MASPAQKYATIPAPGNPARTEGWALLESARRLEDAKARGRDDLLAAVRLNWRLWTIFQASLIDQECPMPIEPRRNLLRLADFIDRHTALILGDPTPDKLDELVNINRHIGQGLLEGARASAAKQADPNAPSTIRETA
jgi:flagellar protein FlaF